MEKSKTHGKVSKHELNHEKHVESIVAEDSPEEPGHRGVWKFFVAFGIILFCLAAFLLWSKYSQVAQKENDAYNGFDFSSAQGGLWITRIEIGAQPYDIPFYNHPKDLEDIPVTKGAIDPVYSRPSELVISVDPNANSKVVVAAVEISRITGTKYGIFNIPTRSAISSPTDAKIDLTVMNCNNATSNRVVIQFIQGRQDAIDVKGNCVILQYANVNESVRVADRYAYMLLKIMK